jgi:predicted acylesterase/phospholipase RssA
VAEATDGVSAAAYGAPELECDIVMKGGVTSGVVYPHAACEIARDYRFRSIGGTSAGALAAAATAAAEHGRHSPGGGFAEFERVAAWLGGRSADGRRSNLRALFQPQPATAPVFRTLLAVLGGHDGGPAGVRALPGALARAFPGAAALGALPGLVLAALAAIALDPLWARIVFGAVGVLLAVAGAAVAAAAALTRATRSVPANFFGLCTGMDGADTDGAPPLTVWLADVLDRLAGKPPESGPLTFGDLRGSRGDGEHAIDLRLMTTNLTHGRPYVLPFDDGGFYYREEELRRLFPARIVEWLNAHPPAGTEPARYAGFRPLPDAADLPVVVATRLSLSFPLLISAVPLYAIDYTRRRPEDRVPDLCWFSDGGICSNFPVHFFDRALPGRPTFAMNLRPFHVDYPRSESDEARNSWIPNRNEQGLLEWWDRSIHTRGVSGVISFLAAIRDAMQNWVDNAQLKAPGYRDRVVHVSLAGSEGGLNLDMPSATIERLGLRGQLAARKLARRFGHEGDGTPLDWDNHRWVRYRSAMNVLERMLRDMRAAVDDATPGRGDYETLLNRPLDSPPRAYPWRGDAHRAEAIAATHALLDLPFAAPAAPPTFGVDAPKPEPVLRPVPRL